MIVPYHVNGFTAYCDRCEITVMFAGERELLEDTLALAGLTRKVTDKIDRGGIQHLCPVCMKHARARAPTP